MKHFAQCRPTSRANSSSAAAAPRPPRRGALAEPRLAASQSPLIELVLGDVDCSAARYAGGSSSRRSRRSVQPVRAVKAPDTTHLASSIAVDPPHRARRQLGISSHSIPVASDDLSGGSDSENHLESAAAGPAAAGAAGTPHTSHLRRRPAAQSASAAQYGSGGVAAQATSSRQQQQKHHKAPPPPPSSPTHRRLARLEKAASTGVLCVALVLLAAAAATTSSSSSRVLGAVARSSSSGSSGAQPATAAAGGGWWTPAAPGSRTGSSSQHGYPAPLRAAAAWVHAAAGWQRRAAASASAAAAAAGRAAQRSASSSWMRSMHGGSAGAGGQQHGLEGAATPLAAASSQGASAAADDGGAPQSGDSSSSGSHAAPGSSIRMYVVVDAAAPSPFKAHSPQAADGAAGPDWSSSWGDVVAHMARRLAWTDERFDLQVISQQQLRESEAARSSLHAALTSSGSSPPPLLFGIGLTDPSVASFLAEATAQLPTALFWDSPQLGAASRVDGFAPATAGPFAQLLAQRIGFSREAKAAQVLKTLDILWARQTSDDLLYVWLVLLNQYVTPVPLVANTTKGTDAASLLCMIRHCGRQIMDCVGDKTCKAGLDCLEGCEFNDQVCQYRCIVSHETPQFEQFALCILQLHNCRGLDAQIPMQPDPAPMASWRGSPLTHEAAEDLFIGWMAAGPQLPSPDAPLQPFSWLVAAGKNPAYDAFGCQHQLYSRGRGKGQLWYEPVFKVTTLEGQDVWRRRRYRVRRGSTPGTFHYSVLDNGVTSKEYWRIIDCAEDLSYCLFYYSGAAAAAGMSYSGAVLGTRDGQWPSAYTERVHGALRDAGIEPWELSIVDNSACAGAPLAA